MGIGCDVELINQVKMVDRNFGSAWYLGAGGVMSVIVHIYLAGRKMDRHRASVKLLRRGIVKYLTFLSNVDLCDNWFVCIE